MGNINNEFKGSQNECELDDGRVESERRARKVEERRRRKPKKGGKTGRSWDDPRDRGDEKKPRPPEIFCVPRLPLLLSTQKMEVEPLPAPVRYTSFVKTSLWGGYCCEGHDKVRTVGRARNDLCQHYRRNHPSEKERLDGLGLEEFWAGEARLMNIEIFEKRSMVRRGDVSIVEFMSSPLEKTNEGFRCPDCRCVFFDKSNAKRHMRKHHPHVDVDSLKTCVPIFKSICGRWIDAEAAMEDFASQAEVLR